MIEDLLIEFDEMGFAPTTPCENPEKYAVEWKKRLVAEIDKFQKACKSEWIGERKMRGMKDGIYFEIFAVKDGVRYNVKIIDGKEVSGIMANSVMDGLGKVIGFEDIYHPTEKGGEVEE